MTISLSYRGTGKRGIEAWQSLVHVCRRWRNLVFGSPRHLNLRLCCTPDTPVKDRLRIWPAFPLIIQGYMRVEGTDNIIAAFRQINRVSQVDLVFTNRQLERVLVAMQVPFPELTYLRISLYSGTPPPVIPLPDSFLGGSAPSLRYFESSGIPFPGMSKLLRSATHLVSLRLTNIPHSGYISPEAIVALISVLSSLETISLGFQSSQSRPNLQSRSLPPPKRSILPALRRLYFKGVTEYLEQLVTGIDTPQLDEMHIAFFNQIDFDCPRLAQFINCTPTLRVLNEVHVFDDSIIL